MEKWCRPVFDKSVDPRRMANARENSELVDIIARREHDKEMALRLVYFLKYYYYC